MAVLLCPASLMAQQPGDLDAGFGVGGKVVTDFYGDNDEGQALVLQPDGKIVLAGYSFNPAVGVVEFALARYLVDGAPDPTFGDDGLVTTGFGGVNALAHAVALQPDGKIIAAGQASDAFEFALARYLPDGTLDTTFGGDGKVTTSIDGSVAYAVLLQPDGKIVAVGTTAMARYLPNGMLDATFGDGGIVSLDFSHFAAVLQPDGKIVGAGQVFNTATAQYEFALSRHLPDGTVDATFHLDGQVTTDAGGSGFAKALALQPDGKIVAAGDVVSTVSGHVDFALVRYLPDGTLDVTFSGDGRLTTDFRGISVSYAVMMQPDGKIVAGGYAFTSFALARYLPDGALDPTFDGDGLVVTSFGAGDASAIKDLGLQTQSGRIVAGGQSSLTGEGGYDFALAAYESGLVPGVGPPTHKSQCKRGGWRRFTIPRAFVNQGDCVQFVNTGL